MRLSLRSKGTCFSRKFPSHFEVTRTNRSQPASRRNLPPPQSLVVHFFAHWDFAPGQADSVKDLLGEPKPLLHVGYDLDHLVDQIAMLVLDNLGDKDRAYRLAILVELNLAVGSVEHERGQRLTEFLVAVAEIAVDLVEC